MAKTELDHLVVAASTLPLAAQHAETQLGQNLKIGGQHAKFATHNKLLGFSGREYFEAIAVDPNAQTSRSRWFGLDAFSGAPRLLTWVCRVPNMDAAVRLWPEAGDIVELERGDLRWRMAVPKDGSLHAEGALPLIIEWQGDLHPSDQLGSDGGRLTELLIKTPQPDLVASRLNALGFSDPRVAILQSPQVGLRGVVETSAGPKVIV